MLLGICHILKVTNDLDIFKLISISCLNVIISFIFKKLPISHKNSCLVVSQFQAHVEIGLFLNI